MGEFHYSRMPEAQWEEEILKMKAAGVEIIATYVIWIHHEEIEGQFDWSGQRDLRRFVQLCGKHGMYVYPRIGPWAHGEVRNGGLPDWVLKRSAVRRNDPSYLSELSATQIPSQPEIEPPPQPIYTASASTEVPFAPEDKDFDDDAVWKLDTSDPSSSDVSNAYRITYTGDVARLYAGDKLLDDNFWNGRPWQIGLKQWQDLLKSPGLQLHILPSSGNRTLGDIGEGDERERRKARLVRTQLLPEYQTSVDLGR